MKATFSEFNFKCIISLIFFTLYLNNCFVFPAVRSGVEAYCVGSLVLGRPNELSPKSCGVVGEAGEWFSTLEFST